MAAITRNPILWQESIHHERRSSRLARLTRRYGVAVGLILSAMLFGVVYALLSTTEGYPAMQVAVFVAWGAHMTLILRAIIAGANTVSREHVGQTWDSLVLTGVGARHIFFGKWWAALRAVRGWMLITAIIRFSMMPIFTLGIVITYAYFRVYGYSNPYSRPRPTIDWLPWAWITAVLCAALLTLLETLVSTALGVMASSVTRRPIPAMILAIVIRFVPVILFAAFLRQRLGVTAFWRWWGQPVLALADVGTASTMSLAMPTLPWILPEQQVQLLPGIGIAALMLVVILIVSIAIGVWAIRRTGALHAGPNDGEFPIRAGRPIARFRR